MQRVPNESSFKYRSATTCDRTMQGMGIIRKMR